MGLTRGSLTRGSMTLPRMNAHLLVIVAAALTTPVAAALATALATFSGQALPRAVRTTWGTQAGRRWSSRATSTQARPTSTAPSCRPGSDRPSKTLASFLEAFARSGLGICAVREFSASGHVVLPWDIAVVAGKGH